MAQRTDGYAGLRTWMEVDRKAIEHNIGIFRSLISKRARIMAVVKSNAYGHSLLDFSKEMVRLGADFLGVDSIVEALALRRAGIRLPILVLGYTLPEMLSEAAAQDVSLTVSGMEQLRYIVIGRRSVGEKPLKLHIKADTGMHRQGFLLAELPQVLAFLLRIKDKRLKIEIEGLYTHFAAAKNPAFPQDTKKQLMEFKKWRAAFRKAGLRPIVHAAATAGTMLFPESHFDMVRLGIGLYGLWPAKEVRAHFKNRIELKPALTWKSIVTEVKTLPKGSRIGYDLTETLPEGGTVGVVPVGYWHGYPRALSSIGRVLLRGRECRVLGRVSMDMLTIDLRKAKHARAGDEVTILGGRYPSATSAEAVSELLDASWYETITRLNPLIKRLYR